LGVGACAAVRWESRLTTQRMGGAEREELESGCAGDVGPAVDRGWRARGSPKIAASCSAPTARFRPTRFDRSTGRARAGRLFSETQSVSRRSVRAESSTVKGPFASLVDASRMREEASLRSSALNVFDGLRG